MTTEQILDLRDRMDKRRAKRGFNNFQDYFDVAEEIGLDVATVEMFNRRPDTDRWPYAGYQGGCYCPD